MKLPLLSLLLFLPFLVLAQKDSNITYFSKGMSVRYNLGEHWKFKNADDPAMAAKDYVDTGWEIAEPTYHYFEDEQKMAKYFDGVRWWRLHIYIDSASSIPLVLSMSHYGASEIFVDGIRVMSFGLINGAKSKNVDPQYIPFALPALSRGEHVIAVRYANFNALHNLRIYHNGFGGFRMNLGGTNNIVRWDHRISIWFTFAVTLLFGIFLSLSLVHIFLYLFYRAAISNLYFSIFNLSFAILFLNALINRFSTSPATQLRDSFISLIITSLGCYSFSGSVNSLFAKKKLRFRIITGLCVLFPVLCYLHIGDVSTMLLLLLCTVLFEAVVLTIAAMVRKVKGARIMGFGILFFGLFFLAVILLSAIFGLDFSDENTSGQILEAIAVASILSIPGSMSIYLAWNFANMNKELALQLQQVQVLSAKTLEQEQEKKKMLENRQAELEKEVAIRTEEVTAQKKEIERQHDALKIEKKKSDDLLLNILPEEVAEELKQTGATNAKLFDHVTVLFTDFVDFTKAGERMSPQQLVDELHTCFKAFDEIISQHDIEKIKTIGDAYMAVCGLPLPDDNHAIKVARAALQIRQFMEKRKGQLGDKTFDIRIGIHSGSVVAGIVGVKKFAYDIWGDTVNTAARMEESSEKGRINSSQVTYELIKDRFECTNRGEIAAKNKGDLNMYYIEREK